MLRPVSQVLSRRDTAMHGDHVSSHAHLCKLCVQENSSQFTISVELDNIDEDSLDLWVEDHHLTLIADERSQSFSQDTRSSQASSPFCSCIDLPSDVDEDSIKAELKNSHLEISFKRDRVGLSSEF